MSLESAWRSKRFDGLDWGFHESAVIVGPAYFDYTRGREKYAESYRELATNAAFLPHVESAHPLCI